MARENASGKLALLAAMLRIWAMDKLTKGTTWVVTLVACFCAEFGQTSINEGMFRKRGVSSHVHSEVYHEHPKQTSWNTPPAFALAILLILYAGFEYITVPLLTRGRLEA